jgi:hypothetical protein
MADEIRRAAEAFEKRIPPGTPEYHPCRRTPGIAREIAEALAPSIADLSPFRRRANPDPQSIQPRNAEVAVRGHSDGADTVIQRRA